MVSYPNTLTDAKHSGVAAVRTESEVQYLADRNLITGLPAEHTAGL